MARCGSRSPGSPPTSNPPRPADWAALAFALAGIGWVLAQLIEVDRIDDPAVHPDRLVHDYWASSRKAFRYFFAAREAIASALSTPGS